MTMNSRDRNWINSLWLQLGISPQGDAKNWLLAQEIEARVTLSVVTEIAEGLDRTRASIIAKYPPI